MSFGFDNTKLKGPSPFSYVNADTTYINTINYKKKEYNFDAMDVSLRKYFGFGSTPKRTRKLGDFYSR